MLSFDVPILARGDTDIASAPDGFDEGGSPTSAMPTATVSTGTSPTPGPACMILCVEDSAANNGCIHTPRDEPVDFGCWCLSRVAQSAAADCVTANCAPDDMEVFLEIQGEECDVGASSTISRASRKATSSATGPITSVLGIPTPVPERLSESAGHNVPTSDPSSRSSAIATFPPSSKVGFSGSAADATVSTPPFDTSLAPHSSFAPSAVLSDAIANGTASTSGQSVPATTTLVLTSSGSNTHTGPSSTLVIALSTSLGGAVALVALLLVRMLFVRRRRRKVDGSRTRASAHDVPTASTIPEDGAPGNGVRELLACDEAIAALSSTAISPTDDYLGSSPPDPHFEPSAMQPTTRASSPIPTGSTGNTVSSVSDPVESVALSPPDVPALAPPEHVEDEKAPTPLVDASYPGDMRQVGPHTEQQDTPSPTAAREAFDRAARREDYGLFDTEIADDEDPPPYEPRAQDL